MTTKSLFQTLRRAALCLCLALAFVAVAVPARADNPPKLSDPAATAYLQKLSDTMDVLLKAYQDKDEAKEKELGDKFTTTMNEGDTIMNKLPPADLKTATDWAEGQMKKLKDAGFAAP